MLGNRAANVERERQEEQDQLREQQNERREAKKERLRGMMPVFETADNIHSRGLGK